MQKLGKVCEKFHSLTITFSVHFQIFFIRKRSMFTCLLFKQKTSILALTVDEILHIWLCFRRCAKIAPILDNAKA